jgi:mannose-6-phosphate isomerase-like protein (cupin superfamily)
VTDQWYNQTLCKVNDSVVRLGVLQGEYHWHKHNNDDEFFFVLSGKFIIDLEDRSVELVPNQGFVVPKGIMHCTRAPEKSVILMVETAARQASKNTFRSGSERSPGLCQLQPQLAC